MDDTSPINVDTVKVIDWLKSRRHIPENWPERLVTIRRKIGEAILDMPQDNEIVKTVQVKGQNFLTYPQCLKIVKILKETGEGGRTVFGGYKSQRMQLWLEIRDLYEKDNIYLAECASTLRDYASREIPAYKRQVHKLTERQAECEKQIKDCDKSEAFSQKRFNAACEQMGIKGENIKSELNDKLKELPKLYEEIAEKIKIVKPSIELYKAFNKYLSGQDIDIPIMATLIYIIEHGNTTTYEFLYGEKPLTIKEPDFAKLDESSKGRKERKKSKSDVQESNKVDDEVEKIDFGDREGEIDFGGKEEEIDFGAKAEEIDFGDQIVIESPEKTEQVINGGSSRGSSSEEFEIINYDDLHPELEINLEESGIVVEQSSQEGGIACGEQALTILDNPKHRDLIVNDLSELEAFLKMRVFEMSHESDLLSMSQMQNAPTLLQMQTLETVTALADCVNVALSHMTGKKIQHLHNIKHSPNYVDLLIEEFQQQLSVIARKKSSREFLQKKIAIIGAEIRKLDVGIKWAIANTKRMQQEVESALTNIYKGRKVNIVGCVNSL